MFGRQQPKSQPQAPKDFDLDELLNSTLKDVDDDLDMNDPELLKQLQDISSGDASASKKAAAKPAPKRKPAAQNMDIDIDSFVALAQGDDDDVHVDFDENDLSDPRLLNELSSLGASPAVPEEELSKETVELINMGFKKKQAEKALQMFDNNLERAANYLFDSPGNADEEEEEVEEEEEKVVPATTTTRTQPTPIRYDYGKDDMEEEHGEEETEEEESIDPQFWKAKAAEYQKLALAAKKSGDKKKAVALLRESKAFNAKYQDLMDLHQPMDVLEETPATSIPAPVSEAKVPQPSSPQTASPPQPPPPQITPTPPAPPVVETPRTAQQTTQDLQQVQEVLNKVIVLQKQYKEAALHYKHVGNLIAAKQMVRTSKDLLHTGISLKNGEITNINAIKLPEAPDMNLGDGKIRQVAEVSAGVNSYEQIEAQLTYQMNICHNLSIQNGSQGKKSSKMLSDVSDNYAQAEKAFSTDLVSLGAHKSSNQSIPSLHYEQVDYTYKNILDNIPDNMMEFKIIRAVSLPTLDISTKLEPFVTWDFGGWPPENTAQAAMNKGETPVVPGINPEYDFSTQIPISRTNRLFTRYLQRKKLTIEVFHNKYTYGLFRRPTSLGKVVIPMDRLLTKSSISGLFELLDGSRKKTGGKIEIQVNLREPLTGEDIVKKSERWLVLDSFGSTVSQCLSNAGLTVGGPYVPPPQSTSQSPVVQQSTPSPQPPSVTPPPPPSATKEAPAPSDETAKPNPIVETKDKDTKMTEANEEGGELEQAEEEFNSVDNIVSNMVMEHEMGLVNAGIASKQSAKVKEDLMDRKQAIEIKMNMLVIQVQTGILDMDTYLSNVQKRMDADRRLALIFKKHGRLDLAKAALTRKKIMQDELDEARAAMAAQQEEE